MVGTWVFEHPPLPLEVHRGTIKIAYQWRKNGGLRRLEHPHNLTQCPVHVNSDKKHKQKHLPIIMPLLMSYAGKSSYILLPHQT